jgi:hypothetical protein
MSSMNSPCVDPVFVACAWSDRKTARPQIVGALVTHQVGLSSVVRSHARGSTGASSKLLQLAPRRIRQPDRASRSARDATPLGATRDLEAL